MQRNMWLKGLCVKHCRALHVPLQARVTLSACQLRASRLPARSAEQTDTAHLLTVNGVLPAQLEMS